MNKKQLSNNHLSLLADILFNFGNAMPLTKEDQRKLLLSKALVLYIHLSANEKNYSFEWPEKINRINKII